ncbi:Shedu anti-phage system protein SduA domain-containing protein [Roseivirga pacifica]|uniref:Shedu anti-phage system protein SduA domain-containing protein n=1 Tax=Roseivirga pacifica TaxID=1267423 RepID=UPI00227BE9A2|nr:Shedu anti-phage system protein SduA domain-containing protein [Roseivirga pacifica]
MKGLFKRNYNELTKEEINGINQSDKLWSKKMSKSGFSAEDLFKFHELSGEAGHHYRSYFPNHYLPLNYTKHEYLGINKFEEFKKLLSNKKTNELDLLNFIYKTESYFIVESLFDFYDFGHHDSYLFRELPLHPNFVVDFLLVGKNSGGYEFIFMEFEHPNEKATIKDGSFSKSFRNGIRQVEDWDNWIDKNYPNLFSLFQKVKNPRESLPEEFYVLDKSRIHYMVIAGRRGDFSDKTYRLKRKTPKNLKLLHYDNLLDAIHSYLFEQYKVHLKVQ